MRIIVDAMGGDHSSGEMVAGAAMAADALDVEIILTGPGQELAREMAVHGKSGRVEVVDAPEVIEPGDPPVYAVRRKGNSSLIKGLALLKEGRGDALVSAGNTGALMAGSLLLIGKARGISRPALGAMLPTRKGGGTLLLDVGANMDARPDQLYQYAVLGSVYLEEVAGVIKPRVGILNVGTEEGKGNEVVKNAYSLLRNSRLNFVGNVEARDLLLGRADVLVCDGFVGNVALKMTEGLGRIFLGLVKEELSAGIITRFGSLFLRRAFGQLRRRLDYSEYGGTPLLGINGAVIKCHGSSNREAIFNGIKVAKTCADHRFWERLIFDGSLGEEESLGELRGV